MQLVVLGQVFPHAPQWAGSFSVSTQRPPQSRCPVGHVHSPPVHIVPLGQALPHAPQFVRLVRVSMQLVPQ